MAEKTLGEIAREAWVWAGGPTTADDWEKAANAVIAAHEARRWKAIETAPKDGYILAYSPERKMSFQVIWCDYWSDWQLLASDGVATMEFTHWSALPAPPKEVE